MDSGLLQRDDCFDFHGHAGRQRCNTNRGTRVAAGVAEHFYHQIRGAVGDGALTVELRRAGDEDTEAYDASHAIEPVARGRRKLRQYAKRGEPCGLHALVVRDIVTQAADVGWLAFLTRDLTGNE